MASTSDTPYSKLRVVLFMSEPCAGDIPGEDVTLACMLPLGTATFAERVMDSCVLAGVKEMDLVVSDHPESLRQVLHDGSAWGIRLRWHHAQDANTPYKVLRGMALKPDELVVLGHAHQWVSSRVIKALCEQPTVALRTEPELLWAGWSSLPASDLTEMDPQEIYDSLAQRMRALELVRRIEPGHAEFAQSSHASDLLAAQLVALNGSQEAAIPASWLRTFWGAHSPDAAVHPAAVIHGPVLIGPGCMVEEGSELGPYVVLAKDVFIAQNALVANALVMSNTYVGGQISLENAIAQGHSIQNLKWSVRTVLSQEDALMTPLRQSNYNGTSLSSRAIGVLALLALLPLLLLALLVQGVQGRRLLWRQVQVVKSSTFAQQVVATVVVREPHDLSRASRMAGTWGAILDVVQGVRTWFGLRPRTEAAWQSLSMDWQRLFSAAPIGVFHAQAWMEDSKIVDKEALDAADAYLAAQSDFATRLNVFLAYWGKEL
jgi:hypothetical protein